MSYSRQPCGAPPWLAPRWSAIASRCVRDMPNARVRQFATRPPSGSIGSSERHSFLCTRLGFRNRLRGQLQDSRSCPSHRKVSRSVCPSGSSSAYAEVRERAAGAPVAGASVRSIAVQSLRRKFKFVGRINVSRCEKCQSSRHDTLSPFLQFIGFRKAARFECILQANLQKWPHWHSPVSRTGLEIDR
jgi:hypothetical protein